MPFDRLRANGKLLILFMVSPESVEGSNHERNQIIQSIPNSILPDYSTAPVIRPFPGFFRVGIGVVIGGPDKVRLGLRINRDLRHSRRSGARSSRTACCKGVAGRAGVAI